MKRPTFNESPKVILGFDNKEKAEKYFKNSSYTRISGCNGCELDLENENNLVEKQNKILQAKVKELNGQRGWDIAKNNQVYSDKMVESCISNLLPNQVLFAMGDKDKVECASLWIKKLQAEIKELTRQRDLYKKSNDFYASREHFHGDEWDTVSGEPTNILFWKEESLYIENGEVARQTEEKVKKGVSDE